MDRVSVAKGREVMFGKEVTGAKRKCRWKWLVQGISSFDVATGGCRA